MGAYRVVGVVGQQTMPFSDSVWRKKVVARSSTVYSWPECREISDWRWECSVWQGGVVRGHGLFGRSVAKRTCSRRHRSLQLQGDHHVRLQRRGTARWDHPGTCATADKQAVSVRGERGRREWAPIGRAWRTGPSESGVLRDRKKRGEPPPGIVVQPTPPLGSGIDSCGCARNQILSRRPGRAEARRRQPRRRRAPH